MIVYSITAPAILKSPYKTCKRTPCTHISRNNSKKNNFLPPGKVGNWTDYFKDEAFLKEWNAWIEANKPDQGDFDIKYTA